MLYKNPVFSFEIPDPVQDLLPILPTHTFHQNTNRRLRKPIKVFFNLKYDHTLDPVCTFKPYHKRIFNFT